LPPRLQNVRFYDALQAWKQKSPPYSPDLAPAGFFCSLPEEHHEGARFTDVEAIQERVTAVLRSITKEAFADSFQKLYELANCVL
jgi:hypothetical protein